MTKFTKENVFDNFEKDFLSGRWFSRTTIGSITLSVVAGNRIYSSPRLFLNDVRKYKEFEFALIRNGELLQIYDDTVLPYHSIEDGLKLLNEIIALRDS